MDASDYSRIHSEYLSGATGWFNGDFNYDGLVDSSDDPLIDNTFNTQGAGLSVKIEPATFSLIVIGATGVLGRRWHPGCA